MEEHHDLSDPKVWRVTRQFEAERRLQDVSQVFKVNQSVIYRLWNRFVKTGNVRQQIQEQQSSATIPRNDHYLYFCVKIEFMTLLSSKLRLLEYVFLQKSLAIVHIMGLYRSLFAACSVHAHNFNSRNRHR